MFVTFNEYLVAYLIIASAFFSKFGNKFDLNTITVATIVTTLHCINTKCILFLELSIVIYL